jgi:hypothetical protein
VIDGRSDSLCLIRRLRKLRSSDSRHPQRLKLVPPIIVNSYTNCSQNENSDHKRPLFPSVLIGLEYEAHIIEMTSCPWMGGLWGREGVHPGIEVEMSLFGTNRTDSCG